MNLELIGHSLDVIGKILISYTAIAVHYRFRKEHKIDEAVFKHMRREQYVGFIGIALIIATSFSRSLQRFDLTFRLQPF